MFDRTCRKVNQKVITFAGCALASLMLAFAIAGCGDGKSASGGATPATASGATDSTSGGDAPRPPAIVVIEYGSRSARPPKRDTLERAATPGEARALRRRIFAGSIDSHPWPAVDFEQNEIVAVLLASGGGGESVKIEHIDRKDETATVHATHLVPGDNCVTAAVVTAPFAVVAAPLQPAALELDIKTERRDC